MTIYPKFDKCMHKYRFIFFSFIILNKDLEKSDHMQPFKLE